METDNTNQPVNPIENPIQPNSINNQKSFLPFILGTLVLLVVVGAGSYYLGTQKNSLTNQTVNTNPDAQTLPSPTQATINTSPSPSSDTWKTESVQIKKETEVSGNENIKLSFQFPSDWTLETVSKASSPDNMIKNCADYVLTSSDGLAKLTVSPICTGWTAKYSDWPQSAVSIKEENNVGEGAGAIYTIRYFDSASNQYKYVIGEKGTSNKIDDAILITYNSSAGNFLPTNITLKYSGSGIDSILKITDQIVTSLKAK